MIETHPFGVFAPKNAKYLFLGSFTTKEAYNGKKKSYVWFYANGGRNQFWPMLEEVYGVKLKKRSEMQRLLRNLNFAMADIIYQCERQRGSNLDVNLTNIVYAIDDIADLLRNKPISKIFFTSRFVENKFRSVFKELIGQYPGVKLVTLPSPSPRYAAMTRVEKITKYRQLLPRLSK